MNAQLILEVLLKKEIQQTSLENMITQLENKVKQLEAELELAKQKKGKKKDVK